MAIRLRCVDHPNGRRRLVVLLRLDGLFTFIEEELVGGLAEAAEPQEWVVNERSLVAGLYGSSAEALEDAMKWFDGYRTVH